MNYRRKKRSRSLPSRRAHDDESADDSRTNLHNSSNPHILTLTPPFVRHRGPTNPTLSPRRWTADEGTFDDSDQDTQPNSRRSTSVWSSTSRNAQLFVQENDTTALPSWLFEIDEDIANPRPLLDELNIDILKFFRKLLWVMVWMWLPTSQGHTPSLIHTPDFWGALFVVFSYAVILQKGQFRVVPWVMLIWYLGSTLLWFLDHSLGNALSLTQFLAVTGYSTLPLILATVILIVLHPASTSTIAIQLAAVAWASISCTKSLRNRLESFVESPPDSPTNAAANEFEDLEWGATSPSHGRTRSPKRREWLLVSPVILLNIYLASLYTRH